MRKVLLIAMSLIVWPLGAFLLQRRPGVPRAVKIGGWVVAGVWVLMALASAANREPRTEQAQAESARPGRTPTPGPAERQAAQWEEFTRYGPQLAALLNRSDTVAREHAATAAEATTPTTLIRLALVTEAAGREYSSFRSQAGRVQTPREATDFRNSVVLAMSQREEAMTKLKTALDRPGTAGLTAYATAKQDVDRSALHVATQLARLCTDIGAQFEDCTTALGWSG